MSLNDGFSETFIFHVRTDIFKVVLNFTKGMYTVYAPNGRILMRREKLSQIEMKIVKKKLNDYLTTGKELRGFNDGVYWGFMI
jgi:hypothetical protein